MHKIFYKKFNLKLTILNHQQKFKDVLKLSISTEQKIIQTLR